MRRLMAHSAFVALLMTVVAAASGPSSLGSSAAAQPSGTGAQIGGEASGETGADQEATASAEGSTEASEAAGTQSEKGGAPAQQAQDQQEGQAAATAAPVSSESSDIGVENAASSGQTTRSAVRDEGMDAAAYSVRLRDLEQRINELKEQIFRSKARLSLLAETVLKGVVAGAQATIVHENRMGASYKLVKAVYALDGAPIFNKADEAGGLSDREQFDVYNGSIVPGEHTLTVKLEYRGHGYGIFSYLKGYRFKVRSNYTFNAPEGKRTTVRVVGYEKGGPTAPLEERPNVRFVERVSSLAPREAEAAGEAER